MKLNKILKTTIKSKKRLGRGYGSGKGGHTVGKGQKGQKTRGKVKLLFEGTKVRKSLIKRLPMKRGKLRLKSYKLKPIVVNIKYLNLFKENDEVNLESLIKKGIVDKDAKRYGVKILGDGKLDKKLIIKLPTSKGAKLKVEKAGGKVVDNVEELEKVATRSERDKKVTTRRTKNSARLGGQKKNLKVKKVVNKTKKITLKINKKSLLKRKASKPKSTK